MKTTRPRAKTKRKSASRPKSQRIVYAGYWNGKAQWREWSKHLDGPW